MIELTLVVCKNKIFLYNSNWHLMLQANLNVISFKKVKARESRKRPQLYALKKKLQKVQHSEVCGGHGYDLVRNEVTLTKHPS